MKIIHIKPKIILMFLYLLLILPTANAASSTKILLHLTENNPQNLSSHIANVQTMLSNHLIQAGLQVAASELPVNNTQDMNDEKIRGLARSQNAGLIFNAQIKTEVSSQEIYGTDIKKAISSISYKILETNTGQMLAADTGQYSGSSKMVEKALHTCFKKMVADLGPVITVKSYSYSSPVPSPPINTPRPPKPDIIQPAPLPFPSKEKPVLWGLVIGVSRYANKTANLQYADKDAISVAEFLKKQENGLFTETRIKTLINEQVTRQSIIENISTHLNKAAPDDIVFIFIAGHGIKHTQTGSYYFIPHDADFNSVLSKGMRMSDFEESVKIISQNVKKVILVVDTCQSGSLKINARAGGTGQDLVAAMKETEGLFVLSASKGGEYALEDTSFKLNKNDTGHGAFTYALINAMSGLANYDNNNYISLNEIFHYVAKQVPQITNGQQHPYFRIQGTDVPFIMIKENL
ncbi:caspase family protein [Desulfobacterales bacterium HSG17]|nr:caspase family protein [Desulfobacterales bacterium HSG17]